MTSSSKLSATLLCAAIALSVGLGCSSRTVAKVEPKDTTILGNRVPVNLNRNLDLLFVIDTSNSMAAEQASLVREFGKFIDVLSNIDGGLPFVHIGVISPDIGIGNLSIPGCSPGGDGGRLQSAPRQLGCETPSDAYISDVESDPPGGARVKNYNGELRDAFSCIAELGTGGCGFEQPLEAMKQALSSGVNPNFIREEAFLAVIIISDEDDCSAIPSQADNLFNLVDADLQAPFGSLNSFRCFEFGVECDPDPSNIAGQRELGVRQDCTPRDDSSVMAPISGPDGYVEFLKNLKPDNPDLVFVASIVGPTTPVDVIAATNNQGIEVRELANVCDGLCPDGSTSCPDDDKLRAAPAVRLASFASQESFPDRNTTADICSGDLSPALSKIANALKAAIGSPCIRGELQDADLELAGLQADCNVSDVVGESGANPQTTRIERCADNGNDFPCWQLNDDATCEETGLSLDVCRGFDNDADGCPAGTPGPVPPTDTVVKVECVGASN